MMASSLLLGLLYTFFVIGQATNSSVLPAEHKMPGYTDFRHKLMTDLMEQGYDRRVLPVRNMSHPVDVQFEMSLNQIVELYWRDEFLVWDPEDYGGMDKVYLSVDDIWKPDVVLYNSVDVERTAFEVFPSGVAGVTSDGEVNWFAPVIMQSLCRIKVELYPFDEQRCPLKFGSWSYDGTKINLTSKTPEVSRANYVPSVEWEVMDTPCKTNVMYYDCCPEPYPDVTCHLVMKRRPAFYLFNLVLPTILLIIIGLLVFCLPPESGEKVSLAITVLLAMTVFMLIVMENVPPNSEAIPLLEQFIGGTIGMLTLSTAMAVFVVNFSFRGSYSRPPRWVRVFCFRLMAPLCCLKSEARDVDEENLMDPESSYTIPNGAISLVSASNGRKHTTSESDIKIRTTEMRDMNSNTSENETLKDILTELRSQSARIKERYKAKKADTVGENEWRVVSMVMDRFFFILLVLLTFIMSFAIFEATFKF